MPSLTNYNGSRLLLCVPLLYALPLILVAPAIASDLRTIAVTNQPASGGPAGSRYSRFSTFFRALDTTINAAGQTAFQGEMSTFYGGVTNDDNAAIWSDASGALDILVREGNQAPAAASGAVFGSFGGTVVINDQGRVAFSGGLRIGSGGVTVDNQSGIWTAGPGGLRQVMREGDQAPSSPPGVVFSGLSSAIDNLIFNDAGHTAFYASVRDAGGSVDATNNSGFWLDGPSGLQLLAREGTQAPGLVAGAVFESLSTNGVTGTLNNNGQVAFRAFLRQGEGGVNSYNDAALWTTLDGPVSLLLREGDQAPGLPNGAFFDSFGEPPRLNDSGHILFRGFMRPGFGGVTYDSDEGLYSNRGGQLSLIYQTGDFAPGAPGANFGAFDDYVLNNQSNLAIRGRLQEGVGGVTADDDSALWVEKGQDLQLVAREGSPAPGVSGAIFDSISGLPLLNHRDQVAFSGSLRVGFGGVTENDNDGIWATDSNGVLQLIAREGDSVEVAPGDFRTFTEFRFFSNTGNADGVRSPFSDNGELVFWANLDSFDGVFVSSRVAAAGLAGDYNNDGVVNAADYTVWRDNVGAPAGTLANDAAGGVVGPAQYDVWRDNYGMMVPASAVVPEPATMAILMAGIVTGVRRR
ncbi:DUF7453 family protein [Botrimarina mediterranea]|uniref:Ice-binding protein C-terminal domain-containing protein n=1 Tax=Botrimarina mediterranea TaxID=2528022 RepID=A0A518KC62_9BACT|nr:choice-of-anchor tandem repeat NxxGxxAF-containing protein [Botrimarina mediterranea]QDV75397.1 hypothetical protein Spa11_36140 [Botrimarina mediterranea]